MNQDNKRKWKPLLNLWPAGVTGLLVACSLSAMTPTVEAIPERLEYEASVETKAEAPKLKDPAQLTNLKGSDKKKKKKESRSEDFADSDSYKDGTYTGSAQGFGGEISVQVTVKDGKIASVDILSAVGETASYFARATTVVDSIVSAGTPNVDTVSGATYSSNGIINAVKRALANAGGSSADFSVVELQPAAVDDTPVILPAVTIDPDSITANPTNQYRDGIYTGSAYGFGGPIVMQVQISGGKITAINVISASGETGSYFNRAQSVISSILTTQSTNVDTVSGATYSSEGILEAVANAMTEAEEKENANQDNQDPDEKGDNRNPDEKDDNRNPDEKDDNQDPDEKDDNQDADAKEDDEKQPDEQNPGEEEPSLMSPYMDGLFWGSTLCSDQDTLENSLFWYTVNFHITIENGEIAQASVETSDDLSDNPEENERYFLYAAEGRTRKGQWYEGIINQILSKQSADDLDVVSSATYSSEAMIRAAKEALNAALVKESEEG